MAKFEWARAHLTQLNFHCCCCSNSQTMFFSTWYFFWIHLMMFNLYFASQSIPKYTHTHKTCAFFFVFKAGSLYRRAFTNWNQRNDSWLPIVYLFAAVHDETVTVRGALEFLAVCLFTAVHCFSSNSNHSLHRRRVCCAVLPLLFALARSALKQWICGKVWISYCFGDVIRCV